MKCFECDFEYIDNDDGMIAYTLHRILYHPNTKPWVSRWSREFDENLVAILERVNENETKK